jgi:hypothetical protein
MPMPPEVTRALDDLAQNPDGAGNAQRQPGAEAQFRQRAQQLLRDPQLRKALDDAFDSPTDRADLERDPKGYLRRKGAPIPDDCRVESYSGSYCIRFCFLWYCTGWICYYP